MKIELRKFGTILVSRPAGREALLIMQSSFRPESDTDPIELDFSGVLSVAPSWLDEVLYGLRLEYGDRVQILPTDNPSVAASLRTIDEAAQSES